MKITFPNYEDDSGALVKMYLGGAFGQDVNDAERLCGVQLLLSVDRYTSYKTLWGAFARQRNRDSPDRYDLQRSASMFPSCRAG